MAKRADVGEVLLGELVAAMESDQPIGRDACDGPAADRAVAGKGRSGIGVVEFGLAVGATTGGVEDDDVEVDLVAGVVTKNEIPGPRVMPWHRPIAASGQNIDRRRQILLLDDDVEVGVRP